MPRGRFEDALYRPFYGKRVELSIGPHMFTTTFIGAEPQAITKMRIPGNAPDKRTREDGKSYTPGMLRLQFEAGALLLVEEDMHIAGIAGGLVFDFGSYQVRMREV